MPVFYEPGGSLSTFRARFSVNMGRGEDVPYNAMMFHALLFASLLAPQDLPGAKKKDDAPKLKILAVRPDPTDVKVGQTFKLAFDLEVAPGWHTYSIQKKAETSPPPEWEFSGAERAGVGEEPKPKFKKDPEVGDYYYHEGRFTLTIPVRLLKGAKPGTLEVKGQMISQVCQDTCIKVDSPFAFTVKVLEGEVAPAPVMDPEFEKSGGFGGLIVLGIIGGLISLVMPCTYPLIPITLTYFVKQGAGSRSHGMLLSTVYSLGIIITFTGVGFLMTLLLGAGGAREFAANPWVNLAVGGMFLWFTGSLFGWYEIQLPFGLGSRFAGGGQRKGVGGAFILGLLFAIVTFTCTIPIAATILSLAAGQHKFAALGAMLVYSATMALPFFLMGFFPGMIREVPKSGGWLSTVKISMAFVELALAVFYFSKSDQSWDFGIITRWVVLAAYVGTCLIVGLYLLRFFRARPGVVRVAFALVFLGMGGFMAYGFTGKRLGIAETVIPPPPIHGTTFPAAVADAKKAGKPLFIEFTGVT